MLLLLGPVSGGSPDGPGPLFSALFVLLGVWALVATWRYYLKERLKSEVPLLNLLWVSGIAVFFLITGVWGLIH